MSGGNRRYHVIGCASHSVCLKQFTNLRSQFQMETSGETTAWIGKATADVLKVSGVWMFMEGTASKEKDDTYHVIVDEVFAGFNFAIALVGGFQNRD